MYCTTCLPRPHYTPELSSKVTIVDFTVTQAGLEDQLLGKLISKVGPVRHISSQDLACEDELMWVFGATASNAASYWMPLCQVRDLEGYARSMWLVDISPQIFEMMFDV